MARGWESKSVEGQIESAESRRGDATQQLSDDEIALRSELESLQLTRSRVLRDWEGATHDRYKQSLESALSHLDEKIARLQARGSV